MRRNEFQLNCVFDRIMTRLNQELLKVIGDRISAAPDRRLTFTDYMDLVLYHPEHGYYSSGKVEIGAKGDFFTSVSLGADFGELLAKQLVEMWQKMGFPTPFTLVEMGAGEGKLAADILNYLQQKYTDFFGSLEYLIIEKSSKLIERQQKELNKFRDKLQINWRNWQQIPENSLVGCFFSNELVDAFPVHRIAIESGKMQEVYLSNRGNKLIEIIGDLSTSKIHKYFQLVGIDLTSGAYPDGYRTEVNLAALDWLENISRRLLKGYLITIDYGYDSRRYYHPQRREGTLQCYYQHRYHDNPYVNIGYQDLTAHVDFTALELKGELSGLEKVGFTQQGLLLMALGLGDRLNELSGGKFNLQEIVQRRDALHQLIDPLGLGRFGVLIQSKALTGQETKNLQGLQESNFFLL